MSPYRGKKRDQDVGPIGTMRPVQRENFERRSEVQNTSATGGAPKQANVEDADQRVEPFIPEADVAPNMPEIGQGQEAPPLRPIIDDLQPGRHSLDEITVANEGLIRQTAEFLRERGYDEGTEFENAEEFARRAVALVQRRYEPGQGAPSLRAFIEQTREARGVYDWLDKVRRNRAQYPSPPGRT